MSWDKNLTHSRKCISDDFFAPRASGSGTLDWYCTVGTLGQGGGRSQGPGRHGVAAAARGAWEGNARAGVTAEVAQRPGNTGEASLDVLG